MEVGPVGGGGQLADSHQQANEITQGIAASVMIASRLPPLEQQHSTCTNRRGRHFLVLDASVIFPDVAVPRGGLDYMNTYLGR